jgi:hypothetical protein
MNKDKYSPIILVVSSKPKEHQVYFDGKVQYKGGTEIDCSRFMSKYIEDWPKGYELLHSYGEEFNCTAIWRKTGSYKHSNVASTLFATNNSVSVVAHTVLQELLTYNKGRKEYEILAELHQSLLGIRTLCIRLHQMNDENFREEMKSE